MQQLSLDGPEVLRLKLRLDEITESVDSSMNNNELKINDCVNNLQSASGANKLANDVQRFLTNANEVRTNFVKNFQLLNEFLQSQVNEYSVSTEEAEEAVRELIVLMQRSVKRANGEYLFGTFNDATALASGERNYSSITGFISDPDKLEIMNYLHDFFASKGLGEEQIAGILGNMCLESGFELDAKNPNSSATGLFQWLSSHYPSDWSIETQLNHAWEEMQGAPCGGNITSVVDKINNCQTVTGATDNFAIFFEGMGDGNGGVVAGDARRTYANAIYYYYNNIANNS